MHTARRSGRRFKSCSASASPSMSVPSLFFFFQAEDGIRDLTVTGVQTCALPICRWQQHRLDRPPDILCHDWLALGRFPRAPHSVCEPLSENTAVFVRAVVVFSSADRKSVV